VRPKSNKFLLLIALLSVSGLSADPIVHAFEDDVEYSSSECQLCQNEITDISEIVFKEIAVSFRSAVFLLEQLNQSSPLKGFQTRAPPSF
tara:strand:+ start:59 stop:328 length:270 start_codon:yes stop_codon:yes gene_type:complete